jgi:hypothetical protein
VPVIAKIAWAVDHVDLVRGSLKVKAAALLSRFSF